MDEEQGITGGPNANMFIELCQLTEGVPQHRRPLQESAEESNRYWHERYRWVEMEEAYDAAVGEFAPPEIPNFTYEEINNFRNRFKSDLVFKLADEATIEEISTNREINKCLSSTSKCCCILTGFAAEVERPIFQFVRLKTPVDAENVVEVARPVEFIVISITPHSEAAEAAVQVGRIFGTLLVNRAFRQACEQATSSSQLYTACKEQLNNWVFQSEKVVRGRRTSESEESDPFEEMEPEEESPAPSIIFESVSSREKLHSCASRWLHRLCPPFRDLAHGLVEVVKKYASDFKDAFVNGNASVAFGSILFIFFVIFSPAITFGTLMQTQVNSAYSVSNSILTSGITTILYSLFAGQPIAIIGPSGPGFIMEKLIATEAKEMNMNYFNFRAWCLIYAIIMGFILLTFNLSGVAKIAKKSMEELFSAFISGFLIIKALFSLLRFIPQSLPPLSDSIPTAEADWRKAAQSGVDAFIALLTVCFSMTIAKFKASHLVRRRVRFWVGAMNVPLGMIAMSAVNRIFFWAYEINRLRIPPVTQINCSTWFNTPDFSEMNNYGTSTASYVHGRAVILGFIMGFLVFVEIGLNSIVPLRGLSKKPSPIVVDHVLTNIVFPLLALLLGMPVMSGVPIRTIANMVALAKMEQHPAPGKPPKVLYLVETRVNTLIVGILVTLSVFLGDILQYIPVAALMGFFLFLGIFGLKGLHFRKLLTAMFSRRKYWSEWNVLDGMPRPQVIVFTVIWLVELAILYTLLVLGEYDNLMVASTAIPFVLVFCGVFRNKILPHWKWIAPYLEKIDPPCAPEARVKSS
ncbi:hypothetical protein AAHC03_05733 [Spirometra sp. Aus1]